MEKSKNTVIPELANIPNPLPAGEGGGAIAKRVRACLRGIASVALTLPPAAGPSLSLGERVRNSILAGSLEAYDAA